MLANAEKGLIIEQIWRRDTDTDTDRPIDTLLEITQ